MAPLSSPVGVSRQPQAPQSDDQVSKALCKFEEHLMSLIPSYKPSTEAELRNFLSTIGATGDRFDAHIKAYDAMAQEIIDQGGIRVVGAKPQAGDSVYTVRIPDSTYSLRMWDGGMGPYSQFCLDFYDVACKVPINLPHGYTLYPAMTTVPPGSGPGYPPAGYPIPANGPLFAAMGGQLRSWERNLGMKAIPEGEEKWSIPEGLYVTLHRDGFPEFTFQMPTRQTVIAAQPQLVVL